MLSRNTRGCTLQEYPWMSIKQQGNVSSWSTPELNQSDKHWRVCVHSTKGFAVQVFSCLTSQCRNTELREMWILNRKESHALRGSCLPQFWEVHWRSRIREAQSSAHYCLPCSPSLFLLCAQELRLLAAVPAELSETRAPRLGSDQCLDLKTWSRGMDGRGTREVCSLTLQCVPKVESLSSYSSQQSLDTLNWKDSWGRMEYTGTTGTSQSCCFPTNLGYLAPYNYCQKMQDSSTQI